MAVNIDTVYKTVLLILNKEQRGYMTPDEFNRVATQVQLEIFNEYFESLNQQLRLPDNDSEYADRIKNLNEKISIFEEYGTCSYADPYFIIPNLTGTSITANPITTIPGVQLYAITGLTPAIIDGGYATVFFNGIPQPQANWTIAGTNLILTSIPTSSFTVLITISPFNFYKLGSVVYKDSVDVQYVQPNELVTIRASKLTTPTETFPIYTFKDSKIYVYPTTIKNRISATYVRKPLNPTWNFTSGTNNQYIYSESNSTNFELHPTEQTNIVTRILLYSGIIIRDPQIVQAAAGEIQATTVNSKS
jgi:hypothetical protein